MSATETRRITNEVRDIERYLTGATRRLEGHYGSRPSATQWAVGASRKHARRAYSLLHESDMRAGCPVIIDATEKTAWIRPARRGDGSSQTVDRALREMAAETRLIDSLFSALEGSGFTLEPHSETRESLAEWRESRKYG